MSLVAPVQAPPNIWRVMHKFKIGDKVSYHTWVGTVVRRIEGGYLVSFPDQTEPKLCYESDLTKVDK